MRTISKTFRGPKRRIERIKSTINDAGGTSAQLLTLHTAEDAKTLVRTLININFLAIGDGNIDIFWNLSVRPKGISVTSVGRTQTLDDPQPITEIAGGVSVIKADAANNIFEYQPTQVFDIKAQRKLKENDTLAFTHIGSDADYIVVAIIYQWFKE